ncbi:sigma-70 family RNA polymerase sigma factor [Radiobacillus sp. PE A8.2]|uniref:sigma-70 family RNA polymerase sigma factor n=1 Tax=Radiobacillus sp. PE A8.2 TaxID=3380349 RepID=UPI00388D6366
MQTKVNKSMFLGSVDQQMSEQKINELYLKYKNKAYRLALSYVKDCYLAEDLAHEILVKCYLARQNFKGDCSFYSWMHRIASNHCIDFLRKSYRHRDLLYEDVEVFTSGEVSTPETETLSQCDREELSSKLKQLPLMYEQVVVLYYFKDQSMKEIADQLNIKQSTVKTRLFRAKRKLKEIY